jgi:hypothetical protein
MRLGTVGYHADLFGGLLCSGALCAIAMIEDDDDGDAIEVDLV